MYLWMEPQGARGPLGVGSERAREAVDSPLLFLVFFNSLTATITITQVLHQYKCYATNPQQHADADTTTMIRVANPNTSKH